MPPFALATKMWIGYINEYIYEHQATYIELFFASPDDIAMLRMTLQRFHDRVSGSSLGHLSDTRLDARGSVPLFFTTMGGNPRKHFPKMVEGIINPDGVKIWLASFKWLSKVTLMMKHN